MNLASSVPSKPSRLRRLRRLRRIGLILGVLVVALVLLLPLIVGWLAPGMIEQIVDSHLNGRATVGEFSLSYSGTVRVRDLAIVDQQDRPVLSVGQADLNPELWSAVSGSYRAALQIDGFELHVHPGREQTINLLELPKQKDRSPKDQEPKQSESVLDLKLALNLRNGLVVVHGLHDVEGRTELRGLSMRVDLDGLDRESHFAFSAELHGPAGPAGRVHSEGTFLAIPASQSADRVDLKLGIEGLLLEALAPALSLVATADGLAGRLDSDLQARLTGENAIVGSGSLNLRDLRVPASRAGADDLALQSVVLEGQADLDEHGNGRQSLRLRVADLLTLDYGGDLKLEDDGFRSLTGEIRLEGQMEPLGRAARAFVPLEEGLTFGGQLNSNAQFALKSTGDGLPGGQLKAGLAFLDLSARDASGQPIDLGELASSHLSFDSALDPASGTVHLSELSANLGPVRLSGHALISGWTAGFTPASLRVEPSRFEIDADLDRLAAQLEAVADLDSLDLAGSLRLRVTAEQDQDRIRLGTTLEPQALRVQGVGLEGAPLVGDFAILRAEDRLSIQGGMQTANLAVTLKDGKLLRQEQVRLDLNLQQLSTGEIRIQQARYSSSTASADLTGRASALEDPEARQAELDLTVQGQVARILADLEGLSSAPGIQGQGDLTATYRLRQNGPDVTLVGETQVEGLRLTLPGRQAGARPVDLEEPRVRLDLEGALTLGDGSFDLKRLSLDSETLRGQLQGRLVGLLPTEDSSDELLLENIQGAFTFIPDRLGLLLAPWLPGELSGSEEEQLTLDLNGRFDELDLMTLLESSQGDLKIGLGTFRLPGTETTGTLALGLDQGRAQLTGDMGANGGTLDLIGDLGQRDSTQQASLSLDLKQFQVNAELGDLLSMLHPSFATLSTGKANHLGGVVECNLKLNYGQPLSLRDLASNWTALDPRQIKGDVFFQIEQAVLSGSPLFSEMLEQFGLTKDQELVLAPVRFHVDGGRLTYAEPWKWTLGGIKTLFTGSIGFDRTLDLRWGIPINRQLVKKYDFLEILQGESVEIPLTGTTSAPNLEWGGILQQLAQKAATKKLVEETGLGGLGGLLGGKQGPQEDPQQLLTDADALWEQGKRRKAAKLYRRLEKEFKLTTVYLFNKDVIKKRADFEP